jgi:putative oxidoreductase
MVFLDQCNRFKGGPRRTFDKKNIMQTSNQKQSKALNITLWVAQLLLAAMFLMAGFTKLSTPIEELVAAQPWAAGLPPLLIRFIGLSETLGALGLLLPSALRIHPKLTVWAAGGLVALMGCALAFHVSRGEFSAIIVNVILAGLAVFVAWGRSTKAAIVARF